MSQVRLTLEWIADVVGGTLRANDATVEVGQVVTDSRTIAGGDLFVALRGPRFDGHAFVAEVIGKGAVAVVVEPGTVVAGDAGLIEVPDTLAALQALARAVRTASGTRVVAITGSAGKTTTKEATAALLATRLRVVKNAGNFNNHIGLPLSLMPLRSGPDAAVMELGMNHAGEIRTLVQIARPNVRVWTNVGDAHLGFFASSDAIADAKAEILDAATPDTVLVCNADDARVMQRCRGFVGRTITFGESEGATVRASDVDDRGLNGVRALVSTPSGRVRIHTPLLGRGNLSNVLAAVAVADHFGVPLADIAEAVAHLTPADRRGVVRRLRRNIVLVDDSYNSSPAALRLALDLVARETSAAGKVAVLGEMLELGEHATALHGACGAAAATVGLRLLFAVGGAAAGVLAEAAVAAGMPVGTVRHFASSPEAADAAVGALRDGDLVLVKGSRGARVDVVADRIMAECA